MMLMHITVFLLVVSIFECAQTDVCSTHSLFPGVARERKETTVIFTDIDPSTCDDGVRCKNIYSNNTFGSNYVEVRVVSYWSALFSN